MVASPTAFQLTPSDEVSDLLARMEQLAETGDWQRLETVVGKLQQLIVQVSEKERKDALLAAARSTEKVRSSAEYARREVVEKLTAIQRGRKAQQSYAEAGPRPGYKP
jgi:uncharacterized membrane-anchored protein